MSWWSSWWRAAPAVKESRTVRAIIMGLARWASDGDSRLPHPQRYAKLTADGYLANITVHRCVSVRARSAASVPWVLYQRGAGRGTRWRRTMHPAAMMRQRSKAAHPRARRALDITEIEDHEFLRLLERPNPQQGGAELVADWIGYLALAGNAYLEMIRPDTGPRKGRPIELYQVRPDRMYVVPAPPESGERIAGYEYRVNGSDRATQKFAALDIVHNRLFHPLDDWYGLSPLQVAMRAVATDNLSAEWNVSLFGNQARPSGVLTVADQLAEDSYQRFRQQIDTLLDSPEARTRPLLLEGGAKWTQLGLSPVEIDFLEGRKFSRVELCAIQGVPPEMIGDADHKTYASYQEARASFYRETVLPDCDIIRDALNTRVISAWGDRYYVDYDRDQIEALQEDQEKLWMRVERASYLSLNEKRAAAGYDTYDDDPDADIPVALLTGTTDPPPSSADADEPPNDPQNIIDVEAAPDADATGQKMLAPACRKQQLTPRQRAAHRRLRHAMRKHFRAQGAAFVAHMERGLEELAQR